MITLLKPTGKVHADLPQYIEVMLPEGNITYARPCYAFGMVAAPSVEWLDRYKDEILIAVGFENGEKRIPLWMGWVPLDGKPSDLNVFPREFYWRSEKFIVRLVDDGNKLQIQQRDNTGAVTREICINDNGIINLGSENAAEKAALGETTKAKLAALADILAALTVNTAFGPSSVPINVADILAWKQGLPEILSNVIKLD